MFKVFRAVVVVALLGLMASTSGCKVIKDPMKVEKYPWAKETQVFEFNSFPQGAQVSYKGTVIGYTPCEVELPLNYQPEMYAATPGQVEQKTAQNSVMTFHFEREGCKPAEVTVTPKVTHSPKNITRYKSLNAALLVTFEYPSQVNCMLDMLPAKKEKTDEKDPTIVAGEGKKMVSRDNPGGTALERTIIRWYFDSEPRGARVFWRVISSIPSIVKNTNELYLGSTPYEDTRSFNILGLTYENSRDVQIEIKLTRPGYMDQVKRFNVRQAIDQQEISSFFDMVPQ